MAKIVKTVKIRGVRRQCASEPIWIKNIYTIHTWSNTKDVQLIYWCIKWITQYLRWQKEFRIWEILFNIIFDVVVLWLISYGYLVFGPKSSWSMLRHFSITVRASSSSKFKHFWGLTRYLMRAPHHYLTLAEFGRCSKLSHLNEWRSTWRSLGERFFSWALRIRRKIFINSWHQWKYGGINILQVYIIIQK